MSGGGAIVINVMKKFNRHYNDIITVENLLQAWTEFLNGKKKRNDVALFQARLANNLFALHEELSERTYVHGRYTAFNISDPKPRNIHKAIVRDRVLHHLLYKELYPYFDERFIAQSFSCRKNKGTHKALDLFQSFARKVSKNNTKTCYILKCDIKKFFASIDQKTLLGILGKYIEDKNVLWLIERVISSFYIDKPGIGLPLGNLTSQLFVNVYMNEFDKFIKNELKVKYYIRYADDFVLFSDDKIYLENTLFAIRNFLKNHLHLSLHKDKVYIKTYASGVDFLGWVHFPYHRQIRTSTKNRVIRRMKENDNPQTVASYKGLLIHGDTFKLRKRLGLITRSLLTQG